MNQPDKLTITKDNQALKIYFYTVQNGPLAIKVKEDIQSVMAYNEQDAIEMVRHNYPAGAVINATKRAEFPVHKILDVVSSSPTAKRLTLDSFVGGLLLVVDEFIVNKRDAATIKRILDKIKLDDPTP